MISFVSYFLQFSTCKLVAQLVYYYILNISTLFYFQSIRKKLNMKEYDSDYNDNQVENMAQQIFALLHEVKKFSSS